MPATNTALPARDTAWAIADRDQEIISLVRRTYEAFSRADFDSAIEIAVPRLSCSLREVNCRSKEQRR